MKSERIILTGMTILSHDTERRDTAVVIEKGVIKAMIPTSMVHNHLPARTYEFTAAHYLAPGFIDMHIHGAKGCDVMDGSIASLETISSSLASEGVTGFLATTMTANSETTEEIISQIVKAKDSVKGAAILGIHLEGPFISPEKLGAQCPNHIPPDINLVRQWQSKARGFIKKITLAPELPNAIELITALKEMQIIASIGHTNATYAETEAAIRAGASEATHLFNAMRPIQQREPGATGAVLLSKHVCAELIVDGIHLHPAIIDIAWRLKGKDNILLVTDAMRAKCMGDGEYDLGGQTVVVKNGMATLADETLAGSTLKMNEAIKHLMDYIHCSLGDAVQLASFNPARELGLTGTKGTISVGKDADLVILDEEANVLLTLREGGIIHESHPHIA